MLVVMMVLLMGTVGATIAMDAAQNGLRAAGHSRIGFQSKYMAEAVLRSAVAYIDVKGGQGFNAEVINQWKGIAPTMFIFGEPAIIANPPIGGSSSLPSGFGLHHAARITDAMMCANRAVYGEVLPTQARGGSGDPTACPPDDPANDATGTIGPGQGWVPQRYVVDITDCQQMTGTIAGENQNKKTASLRCVLTARGRMAVPGSASVNWLLNGFTYQQSTHQSAYDAQMIIITPEVPAGSGNGNQ